ncbi:hypothetical protein [Polyangium spumosum]|nr:hypothetical protein [Polyangium spumosum]
MRMEGARSESTVVEFSITRSPVVIFILHLSRASTQSGTMQVAPPRGDVE